MNESKILDFFKQLFGDKYKIVPLSDEEKSDNDNDNDASMNEDIDRDYDSAPTSEETDIDSSEDEYEYDEVDDDEEAPYYDISYGSKQEEDNGDVSKEALALFNRDQQKYGVAAQDDDDLFDEDSEDLFDSGERALIDEAQAMYDQIVDYLQNKTQSLNNSKRSARESYIDILKNGDKDDPYRAQLASNYSPLRIQEEIDFYEKIKKDPFYGRFKLKTQNEKIIDVFIGRIAFEENGFMIISPWSEIGRAFRQNRIDFHINGEHYTVINKFTYIAKDGKIVGVKDDSPE